MIHTACPHCRQRLRFNDGLAGEQAICPICQWCFVIPGGAGSSAAQPAVAALSLPTAWFAEAEQGIELIRFLCGCGKEIVMSEKFAGRRARCQGCGEVVVIPPLHVPQPDQTQTQAQA